MGLDVLPIKPPTVDDKFIKYWLSSDAGKIVINPHSAYYSKSYVEMRTKAARMAHRLFTGGISLNRIV